MRSFLYFVLLALPLVSSAQNQNFREALLQKLAGYATTNHLPVLIAISDSAMAALTPYGEEVVSSSRGLESAYVIVENTAKFEKLRADRINLEATLAAVAPNEHEDSAAKEWVDYNSALNRQRAQAKEALKAQDESIAYALGRIEESKKNLTALAKNH